ncbi:FkbM family methyltransferase [Polynucleobacter sp. AP-Feld-500C-C5]|uniref:FkbM family methyltransferase n=1 Tax=Polynucleobacter sp. AP-Feld-500C-C5 TaxID=2576924 RepID=UPI001C0E0DF9|nr:FkbM family methyltransferase [Polynucleobacter sp. AP-Feld-500C-C5]MBU3633159.1 FkbM family methyltransferase [Polynucleobacter sp. AP-Feld-500C-C5]
MSFLQKEISALVTTCNEGFRPLESYESIFFLGDHSASFSLRARAVSDKLSNFKGVIVASLNTKKRIRISDALKNDSLWSFTLLHDFINIENKKNVLVVDFNDSLAGLQFTKSLSSLGFDTVDYLRCMNDLSLGHTYLAVDKEREEVINNLGSYLHLVEELIDPLSKATIIARLKTYISLNRSYLLEVSQHFGMFSGYDRAHSYMLINDKEHYIDVGAAHGDTVAEFYNASNGLYQSIHAFEPDPVNFIALKNLCQVLPNASCYLAGLSNVPGKIDCFLNPENRFGTRFDSFGEQLESIKIDTMRMDDVVENATIVKIDVEGYETNVIEGAKSIISKQHPALNVAGYHFPKDLFEIINSVKNLHQYKSVAIRHFGSTLFDTNILFSDTQTFN